MVLDKYVPIYMYICYGYVLDTYPYICTIVIKTYESNSLEFDLSIRVSFEPVRAGRMHRRCGATMCSSAFLHMSVRLIKVTTSFT